MTVDVSAAPVWRTLRTDRTSGVRLVARGQRFLSNAGTKQDEVQLACAGARRRHGRAPRGNVLCDTNFTRLRAESSSRPESTHHRTQVEPRLRHGKKDDEHRVGGRKPSFGYREVPALVQDVDKSRWAPECLAWFTYYLENGFPAGVVPPEERRRP